MWWTLGKWIVYFAHKGMKFFSLEMVKGAAKSQSGYEPVVQALMRMLEEEVSHYRIWLDEVWIPDCGLKQNRTRIHVNGCVVSRFLSWCGCSGHEDDW